MSEHEGVVQYKVSERVQKHLNEHGQAQALRNLTDGSAGLDLYADIENPLLLVPGRTYTVPTGIRLDMTRVKNCAGLVMIRSGMSGSLYVQDGGPSLYLANQVGLIDNDYQGEIFLKLRTRNEYGYTLQPFTRVAQLVLFPFLSPQLRQVEEFTAVTPRGEGGFGSTGV